MGDGHATGFYQMVLPLSSSLILFFCSPYQEIRPDKGANGLAQMVISSGRLSQVIFLKKKTKKGIDTL